MFKMIGLYAFFIVLIIICGGLSCDKNIKPNANNEIPLCINTLIEKIKAEKVRNPPAIIYQTYYKNQEVFYIPAYCCDVYSELLDQNCNLICHPDGGIIGNGDGRCSDFFNSKQTWKIIWQDERK